ncbi:MAG: cysteine protease StiP family protein [Desulfobacterales bacterium]|nr:cysteine protease StiP family protein [Desulfobacterales bacterium]
MIQKGFSGSYNEEDIVFLLKPIEMKSTPLSEKEWSIQSGKKHYSEMIGKEELPSNRYLSIFHNSLRDNKRCMAENLFHLASVIANKFEDKITLVSIARAGTPIGVLLKKILNKYFSKEVIHFSISIIKSRGIDENALRYILYTANCPPKSIVFIDGWTGKGEIAKEMRQSVHAFNKANNTNISPELYVLSDLCGAADISVSHDDYLIPSSILNSTISGLISRSILNDKYIGHNDFHGCIYYQEFEAHDLSNWFIDTILSEIEDIHKLNQFNLSPEPLSKERKANLQEQSNLFLTKIMKNFNIKTVHYIKPGIGESTRVLLRRIPDKVILKNMDMPEVQHIILLSQEKNVPILVDPEQIYNACAIIKTLRY